MVSRETNMSEKELRVQWKEVKEAVEMGVREGYINPEDGAIMVPDKPCAGRLYGNVKDHKPVEPGKNIPKLREIVSGSGSNTEYISSYVDHHAKPEVQKLASYIEDTPDVLRKIAEKNSRGPLPPRQFLLQWTSLCSTRMYLTRRVSGR